MFEHMKKKGRIGRSALSDEEVCGEGDELSQEVSVDELNRRN